MNECMCIMARQWCGIGKGKQKNEKGADDKENRTERDHWYHKEGKKNTAKVDSKGKFKLKI